MGKHKLDETSNKATSKKKRRPKRYIPSTTCSPWGRYSGSESEIDPDINLVTPAPCSSPTVLKYYLTTILGSFGAATSIFKHLTPGDVLRWMLSSKDMRDILSHDRKLLLLLQDKYCTFRRTPESPCPCGENWSYECARCYRSSNDEPRLPKLKDPGGRLYTFCSTCMEKLPKFMFDGRCLCNTKNVRYLCPRCKLKEKARLRKAGVQQFLSENAVSEGCGGRRIQCNYIDDEGERCENYVYLFRGGKRYEGTKGDRAVNCCKWCGIVAVDVPKKLK